MGLIRVFQSLIEFSDDVDISRLRKEFQLLKCRGDIPSVVLPVNGNENSALSW